MALSTTLFARGSDKIYLAILIVCVIIISCFNGPFSSVFQPKTQAVDDFYRAAQIDGNIRLTDLDLGDIEDDSASGSASHRTSVNSFYDEPWEPPGIPDLDPERMKIVDQFITSIMDPKDKKFPRLRCPRPIKERYEILRRRRNFATRWDSPPRKWYFALNLYQCSHVLPRLMASVVEAIRFLRPEDCVLSIVGGRSNDGTTEILAKLREEMEAMNVTYYFSTSDVDPLKSGNDRITELAILRNLVLDPLVRQPELYDPDATVIFLNDVSICTDDILELVYQKVYQKADMTCAMDWVDHGETFYDTWICRTMTGDMFIEIPQTGSFDFKHNLFWNDPDTKTRWEAKLPFQVYSCWNGGAVFTAKPLLQHNVTFRASYKDECYMGEPTLLCKDFWKHGHGRIAVVPSVNIGYNDDESRYTKKKYGFATEIVHHAEDEMGLGKYGRIHWDDSPPDLIKCEPDWQHPTWVRWDEAKEQVPFDWTHSGYFNAEKATEQGISFEDGGGPDP